MPGGRQGSAFGGGQTKTTGRFPVDQHEEADFLRHGGPETQAGGNNRSYLFCHFTGLLSSCPMMRRMLPESYQGRERDVNPPG